MVCNYHYSLDSDPAVGDLSRGRPPADRSMMVGPGSAGFGQVIGWASLLLPILCFPVLGITPVGLVTVVV